MLFNNDLLSLHLVAVDETEHINAVSDGGHADAVAVDHLRADDAARQVDHLQRSVVVDAVEDDGSVADEGEVVTHVIAALSAEHQAEAAFVVVALGIEGIARGGDQIYIGTRDVINKVQIIHLHVLGVDADGVGAIFGSLEVDWHFTAGFSADDGEVFTILWDIELGAVLEELELGQLTAFIEADDGAVNHAAIAAKVHDDT